GSSPVITGSTPAHPAGGAVIKVLNPDGQFGTLSGAFTYNAPPTLTAVKPGVGPLGGGTRVLISGTGFVTGATVNFGSTAATSVTVVDDTRILARSPAGAAGPGDV